MIEITSMERLVLFRLKINLIFVVMCHLYVVRIPLVFLRNDIGISSVFLRDDFFGKIIQQKGQFFICL